MFMTANEDGKLLNSLHQEYMNTLNSKKGKNGEIYLIDILVELGFLRFENTQKSIAFYNFLRESESNIKIQLGQQKSYSGDLYDVPKNLFKILCAIMNLRLNQRSGN